MNSVITRAKYSSAPMVEAANRWKFHAKYWWSGTPFDSKYAFLSSHQLGNGTILDIGANYGQSALSIRHFAPHHSILCIEANATLVSAMELAQRRIADCSYVIAAVSDVVGVQELAIPTFGAVTNTGGASLDHDFVQGRTPELEKQYGVPAGIRTQLVPSITVDSLGLDVPLMKIDVEGLEANVLRGADATISRCRPIIVIEVLHSAGEAMELLTAMGYSFFLPEGDGLVATTTHAALTSEAVDVVAIPTEQVVLS